uniref:Uncharacterized protein n=1 Tax=Rhizophagus irregularis (strain DAOM 181602 / DAOM 197198 / MUCL 43194) TaxID=747089 RepID=U9SVA1_RHIID
MKYYELCKLDETIPLKKQNPFASKPPFRLGIASTSESGKTSIIISGEKCGHKIPKSESKNFGEKYIPCDNLIVVTQHQDEELWEAVQCFYEFIARDKEAS